MFDHNDIDTTLLHTDTKLNKRRIRRGYFMVFFSCIMMIFALLFAAYYTIRVRSLKSIASARLSARLASMKDVIYVSIDEIVEDTQLLKRIISTPLPPEQWLKNARTIMHDFSLTKPGYLKLQYINNLGQEKIRIVRRRNSPVIAQESILKKHFNTYSYVSDYAYNAQVFISSLFYVDSDEQAPKSDLVLQITAQIITENNRPKGFVILNYLGSEMFKNARRLLIGNDTSGATLYVLNTNGDPIICDNLTASHSGNTFETYYDANFFIANLAEKIKDTDSNILSTKEGLVVFNTVYPQAGVNSQHSLQPGKKQPAIKLILVMPNDIMLEPVRKTLFHTGLLAIPLTLGTLLFSWLYANAIATKRCLEHSIHKAAVCDSLTGIYNRRFGELQLNNEISRAKRDKNPLSIFIIDINNLKGVNDLYGHNCGDDLIKMITNELTENLREYDIICRTGGDEFMAVFPNTKLDSGKMILERIRKRLEDENAGKFAPFGVNFAYGGAQYDHHNHHNTKELMAEADEAMYVDKNARKQGRSS